MRLEPNPNAEKFVLPPGYRNIGWQVDSTINPDKIACSAAGHRTREFDNSLFKYRCTDVVTICDECRYVHHTDMSD